MEKNVGHGVRNSVVKQRVNPKRLRDKVCIGCGAGFGGDRPFAALKLLQRVEELNYLVLECLAERTLAERYQEMMSGGDGFDSRISEWMALLLPLAVERGTCIITNMGAVDPIGAQAKVLEVASGLGLQLKVAVAHEVSFAEAGSRILHERSNTAEGGISTYLGAAPIVECLEKYQPDVVITSRVADAALFLGPMVYELGWNWDDLNLLAQGSLAGHLLECGCQLTGGYFMHPGDRYRNISLPCLLDLSLPYAKVSCDGGVCVAKADGSGGVLNSSTCAQQLLYEIGDPAAYVTPDVVIDLRDVTFQPLSNHEVRCLGAKPSARSLPDQLLRLLPKDAGWKGWGEISYGGFECINRAKSAEILVRSWFEEVVPGLNDCIVSYIIGVDSLKATSLVTGSSAYEAVTDIRLRMDGLFELKEHALQFVREFAALYTNGPAGGGGICTGHRKEIYLGKELVGREHVYWKVGAKQSMEMESNDRVACLNDSMRIHAVHGPIAPQITEENDDGDFVFKSDASPAPAGKEILLYKIAHSRAGDKGNDLNFSIIPHCPTDFERLKVIITPVWVKRAVSSLLDASSFPDSDAIVKRDRWVDEHVSVEVYEVRGICSLNVVVRNILNGGVNCSRRIDRHGKTISDLILCQRVVLPPLSSV
ncbi:uncharacterized protein LOC115743186 isoform X2 [Rhodamnia argentea]|uniref:Uncharacterized protein LOC115743186 isoform X2 n=1 Tax=Rhodamnia argentea TaxID=178133 RepID=A0A8B8PG01_9MYRT|nr:uncharacterized protein LOC115743186 isoform X2 [Rhodamnia argentea]